MGRRRTRDTHLPGKVYLRRGVHYYDSPTEGWINLGEDYNVMLTKLGELRKGEERQEGEDMDAAFDAFIEDELPHKAPKTRKGRLYEIKLLRPVFGKMHPDDVEPHHAWNYWTERGRTEQARHEIRCLSAVLTYCRRMGRLKKENPCFGLQFPQKAPRDRCPSDEEYDLVKRFASPPVQIAMDLAHVAGMTQADIRTLKKSQIVRGVGIAYSRSKSNRADGSAPKNKLLVEWSPGLEEILDRADTLSPRLRHYIVATQHGQPYTADGFQTMWQRAMNKAMANGLKERFTFHDIRAKSATDTDDLQEASDRLGHMVVATTLKIYRRKARVVKPLR